MNLFALGEKNFVDVLQISL